MLETEFLFFCRYKEGLTKQNPEEYNLLRAVRLVELAKWFSQQASDDEVPVIKVISGSWRCHFYYNIYIQSYTLTYKLSLSTYVNNNSCAFTVIVYLITYTTQLYSVVYCIYSPEHK